NPAVCRLGHQVGTRVGCRERGGCDECVEGWPGRGVSAVFDVQDETVELAMRDDANGHFMPEATRAGMKLPGRLETFPSGILDYAVQRQLAALATAILGTLVDSGTILVQVFGRQTELAGRDARPVGI